MANIDITNSGSGQNVTQFYRQRSNGVYAPEVGISDVATSSGLFFSTDNEMMTTIRTSVLRGETNGSAIDTSTWNTTGTTGTGAITVSGGEYHVSTGATSVSNGILNTAAAARHYPGTTGYWIGVIRTSANTLAASSTAEWGFTNANDGFFFQQAGSVFNIGYRKAGTATVVAYTALNGVTSHFNPATDLTNMNQFNIIHGGLSCRWQINGRTIHTIATNTITSPLTGALSLPSRIACTNSASDTVQVHTRGISYSRVSPQSTIPLSIHFTTAQTTTTIKTGPGRVVAVIVSNPNALTNVTVTLFDSVGTATNSIAVLFWPTSSPPERVDFGVETSNGITLTTSAAVDVVVIYE